MKFILVCQRDCSTQWIDEFEFDEEPSPVKKMELAQLLLHECQRNKRKPSRWVVFGSWNGGKTEYFIQQSPFAYATDDDFPF